MVELSINRRWFDLRRKGVESVDVLTLWILAASSVLTIFLFTVRSILEQLPQVFAAWHRARWAMRNSRADRES